MKTENKNKESVEIKDFVTYKKADLVLSCSCGHVEKLEGDVEGGIKLPALPTTDKHGFAVMCPSCKTILKLHFIGKKEDIVTDEDKKTEVTENITKMEIENEPVQEESKTEESV
jgi:hypothetical protein